MSPEKSLNKDKIWSVLENQSLDIKRIKEDLIKNKKIVVICGPTGIGKSSLGVEIALILDTDIISADSIQVYRGMDIGTDKTDTDIYGIKQYMVDLFEPDHKLTVKEFRDIAEDVIEESFFKIKKIPLIVGGSGMYIKAIADGIDEGPGEDRDLRDKLEKDIEKNGLKKYYDRLCEVDSQYASKISENDKRRIIRALEVYMLSGAPYSEFQRSWNTGTVFDTVFIGLKKDRASLYSDIEDRVDTMFKKGLVQEVEVLLKSGYGDSISLKQAVGYKEAVKHIKGDISLKECKRQIKQNSRRLAKKQMTWFGQDSRINWLRVDNYDNIFDLITDTFKLIQKG